MKIPVFEIILVYAFCGWSLIIWRLLRSGKASISPMLIGGQGRDTAACGDMRENKQYIVFGGSSAFTCGIVYIFLSRITMGAWAEFFRAYAFFQIMLSVAQFSTYMAQVIVHRPHNRVPLKAHLNQCGYTTAMSPIWPIFFLPSIPYITQIVAVLRDAVTMVNWVESLPAIVVITVLTRVLVGQWTVPTIGPVDRPAAH